MAAGAITPVPPAVVQTDMIWSIVYLYKLGCSGPRPVPYCAVRDGTGACESHGGLGWEGLHAVVWKSRFARDGNHCVSVVCLCFCSFCFSILWAIPL